MKVLFFLQIMLASLFFVTPNMANAELFDRGNGLIYDSDQNLTWMKNANVNGKMTVYEAMAWAENLEYQGYHDWRLPTTAQFDDPSCLEDTRHIGFVIFYERHTDCLGGELERLTASSDPYNNPIFDSVQSSRYWTSTPYRDGIDPCVEGGYCTIEGDNGIRNGFFWQWDVERSIKTTLSGGNPRNVWAVRDGDVPSPLNFIPVVPCRLFDSRAALPPDNRFVASTPSNGQSVAPIVRNYFVWGGGTKITNQGGHNLCNIPKSALAISISFTAVSPIGKGWLRAWPYGHQPEPKATLLVWDGLNISNSTAIAVNPEGNFNLTLKIYFGSFDSESDNNSVDIVGDVVGYYIPVSQSNN